MILTAYHRLRDADSVPRIRGDDPAPDGITVAVKQCSPHTRG